MTAQTVEQVPDVTPPTILDIDYDHPYELRVDADHLVGLTLRERATLMAASTLLWTVRSANQDRQNGDPYRAGLRQEAAARRAGLPVPTRLYMYNQATHTWAPEGVEYVGRPAQVEVPEPVLGEDDYYYDKYYDVTPKRGWIIELMHRLAISEDARRQAKAQVAPAAESAQPQTRLGKVAKAAFAAIFHRGK